MSALRHGALAWLLLLLTGAGARPAHAQGATPEQLEAADLVARSWEAPRYRRRVSTGLDRRARRLARRLDAPGAPIENPCLEWVGRSCVQTPLDPFFQALDGLTRGRAIEPVIVSAFGNSLIASDGMVERVRAQLALRFGDGGRGVLLVDRMASYGPRTRTGYARGGWDTRNLGQFEPAPHPYGLTGIYHVANRRGARSRFGLNGEKRGTLWWVDARGAAPLAVRVDGETLLTLRPSGSGRFKITSFKLPRGAKRLELVAEGPGIVTHGVILEHKTFGIVVDTLGVPSADATMFLKADEDIFHAQLRARSPKLVMLLLGGNEAKRLEWRRTTQDQVEQGLRQLLARTREAAPDSACLVVGPIDAVRGKDTSTPGRERPYLREVIALERRVALSEGCAFFDMYAAMGGRGSLNRLDKLGLVHPDLVHPRDRALDLLGDLLADALLRAYRDATTPGDAQALADAWRTLRRPRAEVAPALPAYPFQAPKKPDPLTAAVVEGLRAAGALAPAGACEEGPCQPVPGAAALLGALELDDEAVRPKLVELGWWNQKAGRLTPRGGRGLAAFLLGAQAPGGEQRAEAGR